MARLNKAQKTNKLEDITESHDFLSGYVSADEPTQYPKLGTMVTATDLEFRNQDMRDGLVAEAGYKDADILTTLSQGQFLRANAHKLLDSRFPAREEDVQDYAEVEYARENAFQGIREGLSGFHMGLFSYLKDNGADNQTLRSLQAKPNTSYLKLRMKGLDSSEAIARIKETLPHVNTSYPTIDDVEASWKNLSEGVKALQGNSQDTELVERVADAGREYMGIMRRLHDFNKY